MDGHIRHLHCRYRVLGGRDALGRVTRRLERVARQALLEAYAAALEEHFGDHPEVVVVRSVHARHVLPLDQTPGDAQLARRWGERLAASVVRRISEAGPGDADVVRFADQADYTARFLADLLQGRAWDRWYYGAFRHLRELPHGEAVTRVLLDNREHVHGILVLLHRRQVLEGLLNSVDVAALRRLWHEGLRQDGGWGAYPGGEDALSLYQTWLAAGRLPSPTGNPEGFSRALDEALAQLPWLDGVNIKAQILAHLRAESGLEPGRGWPSGAPGEIPAAFTGAGADRALFDQACRLVDALRLWTDSRRGPGDLFARYQPRVAIDWRDARALTRAVTDVLAYLAEAGQLRAVTGPLPADFLPRLEQALRSYGWLDTTRLRTRLLALLAAGPRRGPGRGAPVLTPRQQGLLDAMGTVFDPRAWPAQEDAQAGALRLYAQLIEGHPQWSGDPLALRLVEALAYLRGALAYPAVRAALRAGGGEALPAGVSTGAREGLRLLTSLGPAALDLASALLAAEPAATVTQAVAFPTRCAGVFLLLRALADLKLPPLSTHLAYPPGEEAVRPAELLLPLLLRLAGEGGARDGRVDAGLSGVLLGHAVSLEALRARWAVASAEDHRRFQTALLRVLAGQRLVAGRQLHLYALNAGEGGPAWVAGDGRGLLWPLGVTTGGVTTGGSTTGGSTTGGSTTVGGTAGDYTTDGCLSDWVERWSQGLGVSPERVVVDQVLAEHGGGGVHLLSVGDMPREDSDEADDPVLTHIREREALVSALRSVSAGALGLPQADLPLALLALSVLRGWARWLPRFSTASAAHLLNNFIHRPGTVFLDANRLVVEMAPAPLDVVMEMAGYTRELDMVDWLGARRVHYRIRR